MGDGDGWGKRTNVSIVLPACTVWMEYREIRAQDQHGGTSHSILHRVERDVGVGAKTADRQSRGVGMRAVKCPQAIPMAIALRETCEGE